MPLLAYCILDTQPEVTVPQSGVGGAAIESVSEAGLCCLASAFDTSDVIGRSSVRDTALEFNEVLKSVFSQVAIIPFRFPTVLADKQAVTDFLQEHQAEYHKSLSRLRTVVQMEIVISEPSSSPVAQSGAEYLRTRKAEHDALLAAAEGFRSSLNGLVASWHCRETGSGVHGYALIERAEIDKFRLQAENVKLPPDYAARITGPWPATEFLSES